MRDNPEFKDINSFKAKSDAIYGLAKWCKALLDYHEALKEVRPRQEKLRETTEKYEQSMANYKEKQA